MSNGAGGRFFLRFAGASAPSAPPAFSGTDRDSMRWISWSTVGAGAAAAGAGAFWLVASGGPTRIEMAEITSANLFIEPPGCLTVVMRQLCHGHGASAQFRTGSAGAPHPR